MSWFVLVVAGLFEVAWAVGLPSTDGFTRIVPSLFTGTAIVASMVLLSVAARTIPIGTAYGVWVGIGVIGTTIYGIAFRDEPATPLRIAFITLVAVGIIGLELQTPTH